MEMALEPLKLYLLPALPEIFQAVKFPAVFLKDMNDNIAGINNDPFAFAIPLDLTREKTSLFKPVLDAVGNGPGLPIRIPGTNDEIIAEIRDPVDV